MLSEEKLKRMEMLQRNGVSIYGIAQELNIDRKTVKKYLGFPEETATEGYPIMQQIPMQPPVNYQQRRTPQRRIHFRDRRSQEIEDLVQDELSKIDEYSEYHRLPPMPPPERYELIQHLRRQFSRELEQEDTRQKQDNTVQQEKSELSRLKSLFDLNNIRRKIDEQQGTQQGTQQGNSMIVKLQQQLEAQAKETKKLTAELAAQKETTLIDKLNQLENQITEKQRKSQEDLWLK